ncbi:ABC transporter ATP-binding protein [Oceanomicrobium pacificus]|uniref:sn-glycerol-3-phosphate ABC transporter ATP-binding protein UgpC n=1 Tax=Oceanomicrobium pacificus TaxID=2692916 RepID=A0A6B0TVD9_9RHOB|nr:sn-glycerol-3-phosphate ABC transporter ATP-binding protein UgpC [Oceanomicrobium pacificus]MXU65114.1 sn-glycerol-3-phosphate ABC transporter ATP-binding protein UgpC [Oceanomicrobium pacificus]
MSGVTLDRVVKEYGNLQVVHGVDLHVAPQEFVVLVGPSGCGKSTTLRMIAGLEEISGGTVTIDGRVVNRVAPKDRDVAMVFQNYALYPHLNVADNIAFGLRIRRTPKAQIASTVEEVAGILGLTDYLERRPADLSGGQRQRVAMGRAIVRNPKVFLFDEPLSNLDAKLRTQMRAEIKRLHKRLGATSIYVTHDQVEAMTLADRIVVMSDGRIEQVGTPMDLFLNPANTFVAAFLGSPPMNMIDATVRGGDAGPVAEFHGQSIRLGNIPELAQADGRKITIGIRPEYVTLSEAEAQNPVDISLDLIETLGSEALLHATLGDKPFVMRAPTEGDIDRLNGVSKFHIDPSLVHVFDGETGRAMPAAQDAAA